MTGFDWMACLALFLACVFTLLRTEVLNPRFGWAPSAPYIERIAHDALGAFAGLRGWMIYTGEVDATLSEALLASAVCAVAAIGLVKILFGVIRDRLFAGWWDNWG